MRMGLGTRTNDLIVSRRTFIAGTGAAALSSAISSDFARAQGYPNRDIDLVCGFPAGTGVDVIVRFYAEKIRALSGSYDSRR